MISCNLVVFVFAMLAVIAASISVGSIINNLKLFRRENEKMSSYEKELFVMLSVMTVIIIINILIIM